MTEHNSSAPGHGLARGLLHTMGLHRLSIRSAEPGHAPHFPSPRPCKRLCSSNLLAPAVRGGFIVPVVPSETSRPFPDYILLHLRYCIRCIRTMAQCCSSCPSPFVWPSHGMNLGPGTAHVHARAWSTWLRILLTSPGRTISTTTLSNALASFRTSITRHYLWEKIHKRP